jgi:hypothetical protein
METNNKIVVKNKKDGKGTYQDPNFFLNVGSRSGSPLKGFRRSTLLRIQDVIPDQDSWFFSIPDPEFSNKKRGKGRKICCLTWWQWYLSPQSFCTPFIFSMSPYPRSQALSRRLTSYLTLPPNDDQPIQDLLTCGREIWANQWPSIEPNPIVN